MAKNCFKQINNPQTLKMSKNKVTKEDYFKKMEEIKEDLCASIVGYVKKYFKDKTLQEKILILVKRREKKLLARPLIARFGYELAEGKNWKEIVLPGMLLEIENISTYQSNVAFDGKYGVASDEIEKINQTVASFLTRDLIQSIIDTKISKKYGHEIALEFSNLINEIDICNYIGQFNEVNKLNARKFDFKISLPDYLKIYLSVKLLYGGIWIKNCLLTGLLFAQKDIDHTTKEILEKFGIYCGTPYTIINDISDYCIVNTERGFKISIHDQFKDLWNGRITMPLYYVLSSCSKASKDDKIFLRNCLAEKNKKTVRNMRKVLKILIKSGSLDYCYSVMNFLRRKAKEEIKKLPQSRERDYLLLLNSAIRTNKFVAELRKHGMKLIELDSETLSFLQNFEKNVIKMRG